MTHYKDSLTQLTQRPDDEIDTTEIPEMDETWFARARLVMPSGSSKKTVTLRLDQDILEWFKAQGSGHLTRMNAVLRSYMLAHRGD